MADELAGKVLNGRYELLRLLGRGGMGEVWLARDRTLGRQVAVKLLANRFTTDPQLAGRLRREADTMARLFKHDNIVTILDLGEEQGQPYLVMEHVQGASLQESPKIVPHSPAEFARIIAIAAQIARALEHAHELGVVHRDVKPGNILIRARDGRALLADFGIARRVAGGEKTTRGMLTPEYMAPERTKDEPVGPASDIYSLGVVLYELLTGRLPFEGENDWAIVRKHVEEAPVPPRQLNPDVPEWLDAIVVQALNKQPHQRFTSAGALAHVLEQPFPREAPATETRTLPAVAPATAVLPPPGEPVAARPPLAAGADSRGGKQGIYRPASGVLLPFVLRIGPWKIVLSGPFWWALRAWLAGPVWLRLRRFALVAGTFSLLILLVLGVVGIIRGGILPLSGGPGSPVTASPTGQIAAAASATPADGGTDSMPGQAAPEITLIPTAAATDQPPHTPIPIPTTDLPGTAAAQHATATTLAAAAAAATAGAISAETGTAVASSATHEAALAGTATQAATETAAAIAVAEDEARRSLTAAVATAEANNRNATAVAATATRQAEETAAAVAARTREAVAAATRHAAETATAIAVAEQARADATRHAAETATAQADLEARQASTAAAATSTAAAGATAAAVARQEAAQKTAAANSTATAAALATATAVTRLAIAAAQAETARPTATPDGPMAVVCRALAADFPQSPAALSARFNLPAGSNVTMIYEICGSTANGFILRGSDWVTLEVPAGGCIDSDQDATFSDVTRPDGFGGRRAMSGTVRAVNLTYRAGYCVPPPTPNPESADCRLISQNFPQTEGGVRARFGIPDSSTVTMMHEICGPEIATGFVLRGSVALVLEVPPGGCIDAHESAEFSCETSSNGYVGGRRAFCGTVRSPDVTYRMKCNP